MHRLPASLFAASLLLVSTTGYSAVRPHHHSSSHALVRHSATTRGHRTEHLEHAVMEHGPSYSMSSERATEIQNALIKLGYLSGEPSGSWDASSVAAMQKLQSDNGWQTKLVPDSRALIKLGLGPNNNSAPQPTTTASMIAESAKTF